MTAIATPMAHVYNETQLSLAVEQILWRVRLIEAQFTLMSERLGVPHHPVDAMLPTQVVELLVRADQTGDGPEPSMQNAGRPRSLQGEPD